MATAIQKRSRAKSKNKKNLTYAAIGEKIKNILFSTQGLPIFLMVVMLGILFILFRMKGVELNYNITAKNKDIEHILVENKEYKARKARLLSVKNLNRMAKKYKLLQPKEKQIIVIP